MRLNDSFLAKTCKNCSIRSKQAMGYMATYTPKTSYGFKKGGGTPNLLQDLCSTNWMVHCPLQWFSDFSWNQKIIDQFFVETFEFELFRFWILNFWNLNVYWFLLCSWAHKLGEFLSFQGWAKICTLLHSKPTLTIICAVDTDIIA